MKIWKIHDDTLRRYENAVSLNQRAAQLLKEWRDGTWGPHPPVVSIAQWLKDADLNGQR
jgi:hypothetical protein